MPIMQLIKLSNEINKNIYGTENINILIQTI